MNEQHETTAVSKAAKPAFSRKLRLGTVAMITTAVVVAAILLLNVVMDAIETRYPLTVDLTAEGTFSLSEQSIELASGLTKDVEIIAFRGETYFSSPNTGYEQLNTIVSQFYQTLRQYQLKSGGKVSYRFIDMDANPTVAARYEEYDVNANSVLFLCEDRAQKIVLDDLYEADMDYTTYAYKFSSEVERTIAAKINLVSAENVKTVTILTGHDEDAYAIAGLTSLLSNNGCVIETLDVTASAEPVEGTSVLVIPAATTDYTDEEIAKLRKWLDNDGKREVDLTVFINSSVRLPNLYELIGDEYGIEVQEQIVVETEANNVYNQNPYYTYANVQATDFTQSLSGQRALLAYAAPLKLTITDSADAGKFAKALASYGETAKVQPLESRLGEEGASEGVASLQAAESYPLVTAAYTQDRLFDNDDDRYYATNVMVFGSPTMVYESVINVTSACNEDLFLNTFRGLTGLESVISISSRSLNYKTLDFGGSGTPTTLAVVFMGVLPALIVITAIVVFVKRRRL